MDPLIRNGLRITYCKAPGDDYGIIIGVRGLESLIDAMILEYDPMRNISNASSQCL